MPFFEPEDDPRRQLLPRGAGFALPTFFAPARGGQQRSAPAQRPSEMFVHPNGTYNDFFKQQLDHLTNEKDKADLIAYARENSHEYLTPDTYNRGIIAHRRDVMARKEHEHEQARLEWENHHKNSQFQWQAHETNLIASYGQHLTKDRRAIRGDHFKNLDAGIRNAINTEYKKYTGDDELYKYELADEYDATTKIFLFFLFPILCYGQNYKSTLVDGYKTSKHSFFVGLKYALAIAVGVYFLFALFWLNQAQLSLNLCGDPHTNLTSWDSIHITKKATGQVFTCNELLSYCKIPTLSPAQSLDSYYTTRIVLYIVSLVPMVIMYGGSSLHAMNLLSPITRPNQEICCALSNTKPNEYYVYAGLSMIGTHLVGGIIAAIVDIGTAQYLSGLPGVDKCGTVAKPWSTAVLDPVNYPADADCACAAVLRPNKLEGLLRMSPVEILNPRDLAIALAIPNMLYLIWGVIFMYQTFLQNKSLDEQTSVAGPKVGMNPWQIQQHAAAEKAAAAAAAAAAHAAEQAERKRVLDEQAAQAANQQTAHAPPHQPPPHVDPPRATSPYPYAVNQGDPHGLQYSTV